MRVVSLPKVQLKFYVKGVQNEVFDLYDGNELLAGRSAKSIGGKVMSDKLCVCGLSNATVGSVVLHADHLASHAFDEAVERAAFEAEYPDLTKKRCVNTPDVYWSAMTQSWWEIWVRCAKSRAMRAGGNG